MGLHPPLTPPVKGGGKEAMDTMRPHDASSPSLDGRGRGRGAGETTIFNIDMLWQDVKRSDTLSPYLFLLVKI
jgi:hypothetical protein